MKKFIPILVAVTSILLGSTAAPISASTTPSNNTIICSTEWQNSKDGPTREVAVMITPAVYNLDDTHCGKLHTLVKEVYEPSDPYLDDGENSPVQYKLAGTCSNNTGKEWVNDICDSDQPVVTLNDLKEAVPQDDYIFGDCMSEADGYLFVGTACFSYI